MNSDQDGNILQIGDWIIDANYRRLARITDIDAEGDPIVNIYKENYGIWCADRTKKITEAEAMLFILENS